MPFGIRPLTCPSPRCPDAARGLSAPPRPHLLGPYRPAARARKILAFLADFMLDNVYVISRMPYRAVWRAPGWPASVCGQFRRGEICLCHDVYRPRRFPSSSSLLAVRPSNARVHKSQRTLAPARSQTWTPVREAKVERMITQCYSRSRRFRNRRKASDALHSPTSCCDVYMPRGMAGGRNGC